MSTEQNKAIARRYAEELRDFWRAGDFCMATSVELWIE